MGEVGEQRREHATGETERCCGRDQSHPCGRHDGDETGHDGERGGDHCEGFASEHRRCLLEHGE